MKKLTLLLICCALGAMHVAAQDKTPEKALKKTLEPLKLRHRISFSYGDGMGLTQGVSRGFFPGIKAIETSTPGSFNLDYLYMLPSGRWGFGAGVGLTPTTFKAFYGLDDSYSHLLLTIMPKVQCTYFRSKLVELYGTASAGVMVSASAIGNGLCALAWQVDPIAVRVGSERIAGFVSAGWGARGIVSVGVQVGL